ncbi:hypothetical protein GZ635_004938 [Vibrio parahaemolyticus]|nr:hypothetical protein [Vibrio parahaemolyticus]
MASLIQILVFVFTVVNLGLVAVRCCPLTRRYFRIGSLRLNVRDCSLRVKVAG